MRPNVWLRSHGGALLGAVAVLGAMLAGCNGPGHDAGSPTVVPTASKDPTPTASTPVEARAIRLVSAEGLPAGVRLLVVDGCTSCDGAPTALYSVQRTTNDDYLTTQLFDLPLMSGSDRTSDGQYITSFAADTSATRLAVGVCVRGGCGPHGTIEALAQGSRMRP